MKYLFEVIVAVLVIQISFAKPVTKDKKNEDEKDDEGNDLAEVMEYHRYLKEVVEALESDAEFRKKLENTDEADIRSGKIAHELDLVDHGIRTRLDELKRNELERLRLLANKQNEISNGFDQHHKINEHLDNTNPHTFEVEDLKKLIAKTTKDLNEADKKRREEFKQYEMQKKLDQEQKMKEMNEDERKKYEEELHNLEKKHKEHAPLHHPGSKQQLEEVWEKQDNMEFQEFDPKIFFHVHDLDGNGFWDQNEVKALFVKELDKMYDQGHPEDDIRHRMEEMERMREHVFGEADLNKDGLLSYDEFLHQTRSPEFQKDPGWETLDDQQIFSEQEYEAYQRQHMQQHIAQGLPHQGQQPVSGHQQFPSGHHPNQIPQQGYPQHPPQYQQPPQQVPYGNQVPQQQMPPQQVYQQGQMPAQGQYRNQVPPQQGQYGNQVPPQQAQYGNQVPPQQAQYGNQIPPQQAQYGNQVPPQQAQYGNQVPPQQVQYVNQAQQYNQVPQQNQGQNYMPPQPQYHQQQNSQQQASQTNSQPPVQQKTENQQANPNSQPVQTQQQAVPSNQVPNAKSQNQHVQEPIASMQNAPTHEDKNVAGHNNNN